MQISALIIIRAIGKNEGYGQKKNAKTKN